MNEDYETWLERLAESDEFTDYILANLPDEVMRRLLDDFAVIKEAQLYRMASERD